MNQFWKIITIILFSSVKFALGPSFVYLNQNYNFSFLETNLYTITGGMLGVFVFMYFSTWIYELYLDIKKSIKKIYRRKEVFSDPVADLDVDVEIHYEYVQKSKSEKKIFTKRSRRMVKLSRRYGLFGLAALTPILLSIPLGIFIITRLESSRSKILLYMFISVTCWSIIITSAFELTRHKNIPEIINKK